MALQTHERKSTTLVSEYSKYYDRFFTHDRSWTADRPQKVSAGEDFFAAYYSSLETIYEANKHRFPNHEQRTIEWIGSDSKRGYKEKAKANKKGNTSVIAFVSSLFIYFFVSKYLSTGRFWRFSTMQPFLDEFRAPLLIHIASALVWVLSYLVQATAPKKSWNRRIHKWVGSAPVIAFACMYTTGYYMTVQSLRAEFDTALGAINSGWFIFHLLKCRNPKCGCGICQ